ncbi:MAG: hypothetical protein M1460_00925 [Candidatus Thermoplasmatota archaeon]|jgi:hypothetical protein|nr:hypothetical protein [Candidatus Thermoplasmatota archaeon]
MMPNGIPENSEVINFEIEDEPKWIKVKLEDGSVIQVKMEIVGIMRAGNDPNTGLPIYMLQAQNIIRLNQVPKDLIKRGIVEKSKGSDGALYR